MAPTARKSTTATKSAPAKTSAAAEPDAPAAADAPKSAPKHRFNRGTVVRHDFVDDYAPEGQNKVHRLGIVVDRDEEGRPQVAWLDAISGPLELDTVKTL